MEIKKEFVRKMIEICDDKIAKKGNLVGISFYVFFKNENTNPELLMSVAAWWILEQKFNHFEKAEKIKRILLLI